MRNLLTVFLIILGFSSYTQKTKEIGLLFSDVNSFGLTYRTGNQNALFRINTIVAQGSSISEDGGSSTFDSSNNSFGLELGKEYRSAIDDKLDLRYGLDLNFNYNKSKSESEDRNDSNNDTISEIETFTPGLNLFIGLNYHLNDNILFGAEVLPSINYQFGERKSTNSGETIKYDIKSWTYGFNSQFVRLNLVYVFLKNS